MIITVDIGNSRIKWAQWQAEVIIARGVIAYDAATVSDAFDSVFAPLQKPASVLAVCVAGDSISQNLADWVRQHWQLDVSFLKTQKQYKTVKNAYADPAQHGADRWASVVAAHFAAPGSSCCVIGAGTATTIDFIDKTGQHLGGYIVPSYYSMHKALVQNAANISVKTAVAEKEKSVPVNTEDAITHGLHRMLQSAICDFSQLAKDEMGEPLTLVLTGGFAKTILQYPQLPAMVHMPDLVMQGVYRILKDPE